jgi:predicted secreted Zn-dependent protease
MARLRSREDNHHAGKVLPVLRVEPSAPCRSVRIELRGVTSERTGRHDEPQHDYCDERQADDYEERPHPRC